MPVKSNVKKSASTKHVVANSSASVNRLYCGPLGPATQKPSADAGGFCLLSAKFVMDRSEEHTSELQSLMRISYAVFCLKKKTNTKIKYHNVYIITQIDKRIT